MIIGMQIYTRVKDERVIKGCCVSNVCYDYYCGLSAQRLNITVKDEGLFQLSPVGGDQKNEIADTGGRKEPAEVIRASH